ncbi:CRISPR-associated endonuclease Cas2 [Saccharothrix coeruleofusca]|uniref:CRISPR-associated endoribonuclease Cas2 n=1 Tax=Saccharothrix coeruleofusca TaxID=33919 RepID=A0A918AT72_9PSEU|nr:CRISPR-associated endonuclease Cas2 [Saccharothrix coeruleofusca]MBP2334707.1 CRISPR-associated protein Cas2 [Saccharothrix coeruleofusca]GGP72640.1 CRISPR-associated endoribonuclease Cas2 3 [Saccharothrix coeruleofusca]
MELLITYDVDTTTPEGERRLRRVAKICEGIGHRVQKSVFEVVCTPPQRLHLEAHLQATIDPTLDSVRIYHLDRGTFHTAKHLGAAIDAAHHDPLII